jgi:hypothetical protein
MGGLERRIKALFESLAPRCPSCSSDDPAFTEYEVLWVDPHEAGEQEFCPSCGEQLSCDVSWDDPEESS